MRIIQSFLERTREIRENRYWTIAFLWLSIVLLVALPEAVAWRRSGLYLSFMTSPQMVFFLLTMLSVLGLFYAVFNHYGFAWVLAFVPISILAQAHQMKYINNSKPLFPWDILIVWEGLKAANSMADPRRIVLLTLAGALVCLLVGGAVLFILPKCSFGSRKKRAGLWVVCVVILAGLGIGIKSARKSSGGMPGANDLEAEYRKRGFVVAFLNNITGLPKIPVEQYSEDAINEIAAALPKTTPYHKGPQPDIILFVSESFFDMTKLPAVEYSEPVNPFFQELKKQHYTRWISPSFGGQTANAEFEFLTGYPIALFSPQVVPYRLYLRRKTESIASVLNASGYKTVMVHPYVKNFWSRNRVIPNLGFDEFIALEDMTYAAKRGGFVSDDSLASEAVDILEKAEQPVFLYLLTIQNHYPFEAGRYDGYEDTVKVHSEKLNDAENGLLESYANGVFDSDRALRRLVEHLKTRSDRPAIVVFLGDHLPSLDGSRIYEKLGVDLDDGRLTRYEVDGVVWSSEPTEPEDGTVYQMCYLPMKVLQWAGQPRGVYFRYLEKLSKNYSILHSQGIYDTAGKKIPASDFLLSDAGRDLRHLVYDLMFGKACSAEFDNDWAGTKESRE